MAILESLLEQIAASDLNFSSLVSLREAIDGRIATLRRDLENRLRLLDGAIACGRAVVRTRLHRGSDSGPRSVVRAGRHAGLTVGEAVRRVLDAGGGTLSTSQIQTAFEEAGDTRWINLTVLVRSGQLKVVGIERRRSGKRGRAGILYQRT